MSQNRLGELLVREKLISLQQLRKAQDEQKRSGQNLGYTLARLGFISDGEITNFLSSQYRLPAINLDEYEIDAEVVKLVNKEVCEKHRIIPVSRVGSSLIVAMSDPTNLNAIDDIKFLSGYNVEPVVASETAIQAAIERYYNAGPSYEEVMADFNLGDEDIDFGGDEEEVNAMELERASSDAPVVRLVNVLLLNAIRKGASDIHVEAYEKKLRVRYRVDGVLQEEMTPPLKLKAAIVSRLKIMSQLDIAERRLPQDGRIKLKLGKGREMDFRVSVLPTMWGEKVVLRLLDKGNLQLDMAKLGFDPEPLADFKWAISQPWGMVLVTGPTGSGKTTTLYSALSDLNKADVNISTAEDPVEYNLHGINQVQMHDEIGLNFAMGLRSFLRQDPDIIMVGEIRDFETADMAIQAALTGHLVLSTLHTNDAPNSITRLLDLGAPAYLLNSSLIGIMAQRLVRTLCPHCKEQHDIDHEAWEMLVAPWKAATPKGTTYISRGCLECRMTGYMGRMGVYEMMVMNPELRKAVADEVDLDVLRDKAFREGMKPLRISGAMKIAAGVTTLDEVMKVAPPPGGDRRHHR
jgi:type IV pilus assembly protein PilB